MESPVRQYRLLLDALPAAEQRIRKTALIPQLAIIAAVVVVSALLGAHHASNGRTSIFFAVFTGLYITYIAFAGPRRLHKRLAKCWNSHVLEIGPDYLLRTQADTPDVRLRFSEIRRIESRPGHSIRVIGPSKLRVIGIPESIENFHEVESIVATITPMVEKASDRTLRINVTTGIAFAGYLLMLWSRSPVIVLPLAVGISGLLIWLVIYIQRNPNVSRNAKRTGWIYLVGILFCVLKALDAVSALRSR